MRVQSPEEILRLDLNEARQAALTYSTLAQQMERQVGVLTSGFNKLLGRIESDKQQEFFAKQMLQGLQKQLFSPSSEKRTEPKSEEKKEKPKKRTEFGPKEQLKLPNIEVRHEIPETERKCTACGAALKEWSGQFEESFRVNVIPAKYVLEKHLRQKYVCECGACIKTAPGPLKLKEGGRYSPEFGVEVGIAKYEHHLPLERQVKMMGQAGLDADSQTLFGQVDTIAWYLKSHVYEPIGQRVRGSPVVLADETPWKNLAKNTAEKRRFYLWGAATREAVYFTVADSRASVVAEKLTEGFSGILMCDGYRGYNPLASDDVVLAHCWSHARRKFIVAEQSYPTEAKDMVALIRKLYEIEDALKDKNATEAEILSARQADSVKITEAIYQKLWDLKMHLPQSTLGKAVDYTLKLWRGLTVFLDDAKVPLDNNGMERAIRGPVTGRKNHYGSKNLKTAEVASIWYTVVGTCKASGVDPKAYVNYALNEILRGSKPELPWEYAKTVSKTAVYETLINNTETTAKTELALSQNPS